MRYEDAAEQVTVTKADGTTMIAWLPKCQTNVLWLEEHQARYMASDDQPCSCGGRKEKGYTICLNCRIMADIKRWQERYKDAVPWDGKEPLVHDDRFLWDATDVSEYLYERFHDGADLDDIQLMHCTPDRGIHFEMSEYLQDHLAEDADLDDREINDAVNKWISDHSPFCYWPDPSRPVLVDSLAEIWHKIEAESKADSSGLSP